MSSRDSHSEIETPAEAQEAPKPSTRRSLLRRAALSVPVIATVPSGAALARSSNLISGTTEAGAQDAFGRTRCLDLDSVRRYGSEGHVDLGDPAYGEVSLITDRDYRVRPDEGSRQIRESEMCERGGEYFYRESGFAYSADEDGSLEWETANVPRGMLVSATALSSFAGAIRYKEI